MRSLCPTDGAFWNPAPSQQSLAGIPHSILRTIIKDVFDNEAAPKLIDHCCDIASPCVVLRQAMQSCVRLLVVCKTWKSFVSELLNHPQHSKLLKSPKMAYSHSYGAGCSYSLDGRYRGHASIEQEYSKSVLNAYDYGGPGGCTAKTEVVIKISDSQRNYDNERWAYTSLATTEFDGQAIPHMRFEGRYKDSRYFGIVLDELGPDLERLRVKCHQGRFTAKMTLAVAIQTIRIYEKLHAHGWLHCNAKTGNFAIGPDIPGKSTKIFVFDFEWSHRIEPKPSKGVACDGWNSKFKAVNWEFGLTPSRRDDLEGLAYVFSYLERGSHPWCYTGDADNLWRVKISTPSKKLFEGMDPAYVRYFDEVKALAWGEIPDYDRIVQRFVEVWERKGYGGLPGDIDWWDVLNLRDT